MVYSGIHIEYVLDTNSTLYQSYKDSALLYTHFQESYERLMQAKSYSEWVKDIEARLLTKEGEELTDAIDRLSKLNGAYPQPVQRLERTFPNGDVGTGDFFQKPRVTYIYVGKKTESAAEILVNVPALDNPPSSSSSPPLLPDPSSIQSVTRNYGKFWRSSLSGQMPDRNDGGYYYLLVMWDGRSLILTPDEWEMTRR